MFCLALIGSCLAMFCKLFFHLLCTVISLRHPSRQNTRLFFQARGFIAHQTPTVVYAAIYDDELRGKAYVRFKYEVRSVASLELYNGLLSANPQRSMGVGLVHLLVYLGWVNSD